MDVADASQMAFPVLVLTDKASKSAHAYSAENQRELDACPLHTYFKAGRLQGLRLFDSEGRCFAGGATGAWRIDRAFIWEVGPIIWLVAAIISGLDVVLLFETKWQEVPGQSLELVKKEVKDYVRRDPRPYTRNRRLQTVLARLTKATTFEQLCRAIES